MSSVVNPFLYSLLSKRFRRGYQDLLRKIKIWILNLPIFLPPPPNSSINNNDNNVDPAIDPNKTTPSQQEREGLVNSMCCTRMIVKISLPRWKVSLKRDEEDVRRQHKTKNLLDCQIEVSVYRDEMEMKDIPGREKLNKHSDRSDSDTFNSKRRATVCNIRPSINYDLLQKQKSKDKSKSYGNLFPKIRYTMSNAFHNNINSSCIL